jgi:flagellar protein FlbD
MIKLTRLNGGVLHLNADLIATVEHHHDTVLTLVDGKTYVLQDSAEDVVDAVRQYRASLIVAAERLSVTWPELPEPAEDQGARLLVLRPVDATHEGR